MTMTVGPKNILSTLLEMAPAADAAGTPVEGEVFLGLLAGISSPLTAQGDEKAAPAAPDAVQAEENLTIKTFQQLLGVNPDLTKPVELQGESVLLLREDDVSVSEEEIVAAALSLFQPTSPATGAPPAQTARDAPIPAAILAQAGPQAVALASTVPAGGTKGGTTARFQAAVPAPTPMAESEPEVSYFDLSALDVTRPRTAAPTSTPALRLPEIPVAAPAPTSNAAPSIPAGTAAPAAPVAADTPVSAAPAPAPSLAAFLAPLQPAEPMPAEGAAPTSPPADVQDTLVEHQLDLAHEGEWLDRLARDIARTSEAGNSLRFRLNPENLGSLHVELTQGHAGASLRLTTDTEAARAIIADAQPRLVAEARAQGVRIAETHVDLGGGHTASGGHGRHAEERQPAFVRTSSAGLPGEGEAAAEPAARTAERYA